MPQQTLLPPQQSSTGHAPWLTTSTPAHLAAQSLAYVLPSAPHTPWMLTGHWLSQLGSGLQHADVSASQATSVAVGVSAARHEPPQHFSFAAQQPGSFGHSPLLTIVTFAHSAMHVLPYVTPSSPQTGAYSFVQMHGALPPLQVPLLAFSTPAHSAKQSLLYVVLSLPQTGAYTKGQMHGSVSTIVSHSPVLATPTPAQPASQELPYVLLSVPQTGSYSAMQTQPGSGRGLASHSPFVYSVMPAQPASHTLPYVMSSEPARSLCNVNGCLSMAFWALMSSITWHLHHACAALLSFLRQCVTRSASLAHERRT